MKANLFVYATVMSMLFMLNGFPFVETAVSQEKMQPVPLSDHDWNYWTDPDVLFLYEPGDQVSIGNPEPYATVDIQSDVDPWEAEDLAIQNDEQATLRMNDTSHDPSGINLGYQLRQSNDSLVIEHVRGFLGLTKTVGGMLLFDFIEGTYSDAKITSMTPMIIDPYYNYLEGVPLRIDHVPSPTMDYVQVASDNAAGGDILTIDSTGDVGIGTTNPQYKLDVEGYAEAYGFITGDIIFQNGDRKRWRMFENEAGLYLENIEQGLVSKIFLEEDLAPLQDELEELQSLKKKMATLEARIAQLERQ